MAIGNLPEYTVSRAQLKPYDVFDTFLSESK